MPASSRGAYEVVSVVGGYEAVEGAYNRDGHDSVGSKGQDGDSGGDLHLDGLEW